MEDKSVNGGLEGKMRVADQSGVLALFRLLLD